jgi:hypothetical protein
MRLDLKSAVRKGIQDIKKAIVAKSAEVAQLEGELKRHETVLQLLNGRQGAKGRGAGVRGRRGRTNLRAVLAGLPEKFTSRDFVKAASRTKKPPVYLRQTLSRWARQGKIKRVERGKYHKVKSSSASRLAA